ncbi:MAG: hypothetical protein MJ113_06545 [Lachnospiraceae bacterium]|nr:hypothetical protein [Lachnospiraceae bacterium]
MEEKRTKKEILADLALEMLWLFVILLCCYASIFGTLLTGAFVIGYDLDTWLFTVPLYFALFACAFRLVYHYLLQPYMKKKRHNKLLQKIAEKEKLRLKEAEND